jgi:hypothetical protein
VVGFTPGYQFCGGVYTWVAVLWWGLHLGISFVVGFTPGYQFCGGVYTWVAVLWWGLRYSSVFCVILLVFYALFVLLCLMLNLACVSGLSSLDYPFSFLLHLSPHISHLISTKKIYRV